MEPMPVRWLVVFGDIDSTQFVTIGGGRFTQNPTNYAGTIPVAQVGDPFIVGAESINEAVKVIDAEQL